MASKGVDGVGLAALGIGSALMYAGVKGYSFLAVLENLVTGKPIRTDVVMVNKLTTTSVISPNPPAVPQTPLPPNQYGNDRPE